MTRTPLAVLVMLVGALIVFAIREWTRPRA